MENVYPVSWLIVIGDLLSTRLTRRRQSRRPLLSLDLPQEPDLEGKPDELRAMG
jgi:hypothetical protein